ncbi:MAG: DNA glycosylase AlkZ-like family protein, partial [Acidobacteriota bacterium]
MPGGQLQGALDEESAARFRLSTYEAGLKKQFTALHGTAMASLIIWGDLHAPGEPIPQPLYVRPIMQPFTQPGWDDLPPEERLDHEHTIGDGAVLVRREVQHRLGAGGCVLRGLREERARVDERRSTRPLDVHEAPRRREPASTVAAGSERRAVTVHSRRTTQRPAVGQSTLSFGGHRLRAQLVEASPCGSPAEVVSRLVAVQAQDPVAAKWAVGVRLPDGVATELSVEASLADGAILRTHVLRWTWQLVCPADVRWLLALVAPRLIDRYAR